ncbi:hypothetical protein SLE2022_173870 [Rubroshorea leprosula]
MWPLLAKATPFLAEFDAAQLCRDVNKWQSDNESGKEPTRFGGLLHGRCLHPHCSVLQSCLKGIPSLAYLENKTNKDHANQRL